jgi:hypothetical protein
MHLRNLDNTEDFHVPRSTGRALLETGKFVEVLPAVVRQIAVPYLKRISSYLAEVLRFEIAD